MLRKEGRKKREEKSKWPRVMPMLVLHCTLVFCEVMVGHW